MERKRKRKDNCNLIPEPGKFKPLNPTVSISPSLLCELTSVSHALSRLVGWHRYLYSHHHPGHRLYTKENYLICTFICFQMVLITKLHQIDKQDDKHHPKSQRGPNPSRDWLKGQMVLILHSQLCVSPDLALKSQDVNVIVCNMVFRRHHSDNRTGEKKLHPMRSAQVLNRSLAQESTFRRNEENLGSMLRREY